MINSELENIVAGGALIIDVCTPEEYKAGHIDGSLSVPLNDIGKAMAWLLKDVPIITVCASGARSAQAKFILEANGFGKVYNGGSWDSLGTVKAGGCPVK